MLPISVKAAIILQVTKPKTLEASQFSSHPVSSTCYQVPSILPVLLRLCWWAPVLPWKCLWLVPILMRQHQYILVVEYFVFDPCILPFKYLWNWSLYFYWHGTALGQILVIANINSNTRLFLTGWLLASNFFSS